MTGSEPYHLKGADVLVIPGVDAYLDEFSEEFDRGALDLDAYKSVTVRTSTYHSEGEQLTFPETDKDHGECESAPSARTANDRSAPRTDTR